MENDFSIMQARIKADYARKVNTFRALPLGHQYIIIGDSIVAFFNPKHYEMDDYTNMGIAGDTTEGVLHRLDAVLRQNPKKVILSIGSNDLVLMKSNIEDIINRVIHIIEQLSKISQVYILSLTPVNSHYQHANHMYIAGRKNSDIFLINQELSLTFKDHFIDVCTSLLDSNKQLNESMTKDGIHLNHEGYLLWTHLIKKVLLKTS